MGEVNLRDRGENLREMLRATEEKTALIRRRVLPFGESQNEYVVVDEKKWK